MKVLYIMPWFCRPSAMNKHCKIFLSATKSLGIEQIVTGIRGVDSFEGEHSFIPYDDKSNKYVAAAVRRVFPDIVNQPDVYNWGTRKNAVKAIEKALDMNEVDIIHSVSFPCSSHLMGYDLAKKYGKPWIAQFYDPWSDNPYRKFKTAKYRQKDLEMEGFVAEHADAIIHTNDVIKDIWAKRYGTEVEKKMIVMPMSYEQSLYERAKDIKTKEPGEKKIISYIGKLFFDRNLQDVVGALKVVRDCGISLEEQLAIRIIGEIHQDDINRIKEAGLEKVFYIIGYLPQSELERYYLESDAFLVIDSPQAQNVFFPSKLLDYFIYKRMIIGITPLKGVTHDLLADSNNVVFENGDIDGLAGFFKKCLSDKKTLWGYDENYYERFSPDSLQGTYKTVLKKLIG